MSAHSTKIIRYVTAGGHRGPPLQFIPWNPIYPVEPNLTGGTKTSSTTRCFIQIISPRRFRRNDLFDYQLTNLASSRKVDGCVARVVEQATNLTTIIRIDHTSKHIQPALRRQSRSRRNPPIKPRRYRHRQPRPRHHSLLRLNAQIFNRTNIQPRRQHTPAFRQHRTRIKLFEAKDVQCLHFRQRDAALTLVLAAAVFV